MQRVRGMHVHVYSACTYGMYKMYRTCVSNVLFFLPWETELDGTGLGFLSLCCIAYTGIAIPSPLGSLPAL